MVTDCMYPFVSGEFKPVEQYINTSRLVTTEGGCVEAGMKHKSFLAFYKFSVTEWSNEQEG